MQNQFLTSDTTTTFKNEYPEDNIENSIMRFVRYASNDKDALHNLRLELKEYDKRKTAWQCFKMLINR